MKHWPAALMAAVFVLGLASALTMAQHVGEPFGGFIANQDHARGLWVAPVTPPWWSPLAEGRLRYDDALIALNGRPYDSESYRQYAQADSFTLTLQRDGLPLDLTLPVKKFSPGNFLDLKLPEIIVGLGFWLLAIAVYQVQPEAPVNRAFALASSLTAGAVWLTTTALFVEADVLSLTFSLAWAAAASFVGVAFIYLTMLFPQPIHRPSPRWLILLYGLMGIVATAYIVSLVVGWWRGPSPLTLQLGSWSNLIVIRLFGLGVALYVLRLVWLIARPDLSPLLRRQAQLLLLSAALALPYIIVVVARSFTPTAQSYFWNGLDLRYLILAVPIAFAYLILRYQTFQRTPPILGAVFILATSALFASVCTWLLRLIEPGWAEALNWSPFAPLFVTALAASAFWAVQSSWRGAFSRLFNWERRSYTAAKQFGQQIVDRLEPSQLPKAIAEALVAKLELERSCVWLWDEAAQTFTLAARAGDWRWFMPLPGLPPDPALTQPVRRSDMRGIEVIAPLTVSTAPVGILGLGKRWDEEIFDERDLEIVELIAQQSALFILTATQIEQLRRVPGQIAAAQERERLKIAQELHDTVQQFLGRLPFYLEASRKNPAEADSILERCIAEVGSAAQTVREIRNNLAPLQLESSLSQPLLALVEHFRARTRIETRIEVPPEVDARLSTEARHALYRVVQQALDNAAAHAEARCVTIRLALNNGRLHFSIADDGRGSSEAERARAEARGSFGLKSMQARVTALGGEFEIQSAPGAGTTVRGWLPAE
jgi:signal transduction histidine kinase